MGLVPGADLAALAAELDDTAIEWALGTLRLGQPTWGQLADQSDRLYARAHLLLTELAPPDRPHVDAAAAVSRFAAAPDLDDGRIEMDTKVVQRAIRAPTLTRKNALFAGSDGGARHWAMAMTLIQTAKLNRLELDGVAHRWARTRRLRPWQGP